MSLSNTHKTEIFTQKLSMRFWGFPRNCEWWIGTVDLTSATFPTRQRIEELLSKYFYMTGGTEVVSIATNHVMVRLPKGTKPEQRQIFLNELEKEFEHSSKVR